VNVLLNLKHPYKSVGLTLLILFIPAVLFSIIRFAFLNADDPESGTLTPKTLKIINWVLTVPLVPIFWWVSSRFNAGEVFLFHFLNRPFAYQGYGQFEGAQAASFAFIGIPMIVMVALNLNLSSAAVDVSEINDRKLPWYLPENFSGLILFLWGGTAAFFVFVFYIVFNDHFVMAGLAISCTLLYPSFNLTIHVISRFYQIRPMRDFQLRGLIIETIKNNGLEVDEIYESQTTLKTFEWLLLPNITGPVRCYVDMEQLKRFSRNEFLTVLIHSIAHKKMHHKLKLISASSFATVFFLFFTLIGASFFALSFFVPGFFLLLLASSLVMGIAFWEVEMEKEVDMYVVNQTGLYQDYLNAITKLSGLNPENIDFNRIDQYSTLTWMTKRRIKYLLAMWHQAHYQNSQQQNQ
jgi:hypothetical protein